MIAPILLAAAMISSPAGPWRAALDLAGGELRFGVIIEDSGGPLRGRLCNGASCQPLSGVRLTGDTLTLELGDYAATITAAVRGDSLIGQYHNVGRKGPRSIPFRAARGRWEISAGGPALLGNWNAWFESGFEQTPRVLEFRNGAAGLEGTVISNSGDYGLFVGRMLGDSFAIAHFDGSFVYLLTGHLAGDTLRGTFHAGLRTQIPFVATRSTGQSQLTPPTAVTRSDTTGAFRFAFPDLEGHLVRSDDPRFHGKVVLVDIFGTWCPTCHDAAPALVRLYQDYHARGLEIVGVAFEATGDTGVDAPLVRRYREKFGIHFPLLLGGVSDADVVSAALPQLDGFTAFPTTIFLGRDGRVRRIHAGFYGPATGPQHEAVVAEFRRAVEGMLEER
ncbi:MAG TPA: TlpA disulfide reductase family protein [Gemmatimonadales bacterium]|nr:TlpA disulfide reductase family protein [Gemmatimonadales bacterium]